MLVCEKISFENVIVVSESGKVSDALPLTDTFLLKKFYLPEGKIKSFRRSTAGSGSHYLYPLEAEVDKSFLFVFAYDFPDGVNGDPVPVNIDETFEKDFMPSPTRPSESAAGPGHHVTVTVKPLRVLVFTSLVCCKERDDFDPGNLLGGGRMIPYVTVIANQPLSDVFTTVVHKRPDNMTMLGHHHHHSHSNMNSKIENGLWADNNEPNMIPGAGVPSPFWDNLFDCYKVGNSSGTYEVVKPDKPARTVKDAIQTLSVVPNVLIGDKKPYSNRNFKRVKRQGAFDNIHVAPTMTSSDRPAGAPWYADRVFMAPFCEHDCLHTHWRWSVATASRQNLGWSEDDGKGLTIGRPNQVAGAPMVPENQVVRIKISSDSEWEYRVHANGRSAEKYLEPIPAGTFTLVNLHGSAYALSVNATQFFLAKTYVSSMISLFYEPALSHTGGWIDIQNQQEVLSSDSVYLYWHLRYGGDLRSSTPQERMFITDDAKIRDE